MGNNANDVLRVARGEIGYYRHNDPLNGTKYGRWYAKDHGSYYGTNGVPFCAMFASWVFAQAGATCAGLPEAYVPYIKSKAQQAGAVLGNKRSAQPGDLVIFDWNNDGSLNHVGIVELNKGSYLQTIEGNSPAGYVTRRTRSWGTIAYIVRPSWGKATGGGSSSSGSSSPTVNGRVDVDGQIGPDSMSELQAQRGTDVDGVMSSQPRSNRSALQNVNAVEWVADGKAIGSDIALSLQKFLKAKGYYKGALDRFFGHQSVTALQTFMRRELGYKKHAIDGLLQYYTACNLQNAINAGAFRG